LHSWGSSVANEDPGRDRLVGLAGVVAALGVARDLVQPALTGVCILQGFAGWDAPLRQLDRHLDGRRIVLKLFVAICCLANAVQKNANRTFAVLSLQITVPLKNSDALQEKAQSFVWSLEISLKESAVEKRNQKLVHDRRRMRVAVHCLRGRSQCTAESGSRIGFAITILLNVANGDEGPDAFLGELCALREALS